MFVCSYLFVLISSYNYLYMLEIIRTTCSIIPATELTFLSLHMYFYSKDPPMLLHCSSPSPITPSLMMVIWECVSGERCASTTLHQFLSFYRLPCPSLTTLFTPFYFCCIFRCFLVFWSGTLCCDFKDVSHQNGRTSKSFFPIFSENIAFFEKIFVKNIIRTLFPIKNVILIFAVDCIILLKIVIVYKNSHSVGKYCFLKEK